MHIGNFVEVKNAQMGNDSKANHLAYVGDATVGERVNIGAGTIIANYDGANKHRTTIENDVHTGSNSVLVAPITVGAGATIAAGSTVVKEVPRAKADSGSRQASHDRKLAASGEEAAADRNTGRQGQEVARFIHEWVAPAHAKPRSTRCFRDRP